MTQLVYDQGEAKIITIEKHEDKDGNVTKHAVFDNDPSFTFYKLNDDEEELTYPKMFIERDRLHPITCSYDNLFKTLAKETKQVKWYKRMIDERKRNKLRKLHHNYNIFLSDVHLADYKMEEWRRSYLDVIKPIPLTKAFSDIEVDIYNYEGFPVPEVAPCEVNFISYVNEHTDIIKAFVLYNPENPSMVKFLKTHIKDFASWDGKINQDTHPWANKMLKKRFQEEKYHKFGTFEVQFFEDELELIAAYMNKVNEDKPDFNTFWNAYFDIKTFEQRIINLGGDPVELFCPKEFPYKKVQIIEDSFAADISDKGHTFDISCYTHWCDLLYFFASNRKAKGKRDSWKLQDILLAEIGESKYDDFEGDIKTGAYTDFEGFLFYSLYDSYRMYQLEAKCKDIDSFYIYAMTTNTRLHKAMKKTTSIRNLGIYFLKDEGYILSNNHNVFLEHEKVKFRGAFVLDPNKMGNTGIKLNGVPTNNIFEDAIDEDLSSMYPSIILACAIDNETLIGKIWEEDADNPIYEHFGEYLLESEGIFKPCVVYLGLKSDTEVLDKLDMFLD